jgi:hypothetical protein
MLDPIGMILPILPLGSLSFHAMRSFFAADPNNHALLMIIFHVLAFLLHEIGMQSDHERSDVVS